MKSLLWFFFLFQITLFVTAVPRHFRGKIVNKPKKRDVYPYWQVEVRPEGPDGEVRPCQAIVTPCMATTRYRRVVAVAVVDVGEEVKIPALVSKDARVLRDRRCYWQRLHGGVRACTHAHTRAHTHIRTYTHMHTHTHTRTYAHTHAHTHADRCKVDGAADAFKVVSAAYAVLR